MRSEGMINIDNLYNKCVLFIATLLIICFSWVGVEYYLDGQIINQHSDTVYAILLASLITDKLSNKENRGDYNK